MELAGKRIVLGVTGGIAAYKAAELLRLLVKEGASVQVVMTEAATHFVTPVTFQALSGQPVFTDQWDARVANNMAHIDLSREADAAAGRARLGRFSRQAGAMAWPTTC
jgi:phosphopantothenoylcysteine decarboxylase/phosphopantothenate--cysteine ligase